MSKRSKILMVTALLLSILLSISSVRSQELQMMPKPYRIQRELPPGTGFIPPPIDLSHLRGKKMPMRFQALQIPERWDWREQGIITQVQDQGSCGSCYAFASLANIESKLLIDNAGMFDFSENHAKECNWYETSCSGGSYWQMASLFSKTGMVLESCDPYVDSDVSCNSSCPYIKSLIDWRIICGDNIPDTELLKDYIYTYGPVHTAFYAGDENDEQWRSEFGNYDGSYTLYYEAPEFPTNHGVLIVGWDDNLPHDGGKGAWIVKNSWGTDWGGTCGYGSEKGYFTMAYGSANIGMHSSFMYDWQDYDQKGDVLYYDEGGWSNNWGYGDLTAWGLCKFVSGSAYSLTRVEFWTNDQTTDIDIYVYDDFDGSALSNLLTSKLNLSFDEAGYHSVALDSPLYIISGDDFFVAVKFTNLTSTFPIVSDGEGPYESGVTYISYNGSSGSWGDLGDGNENDVAIRARMSVIESILVTSPDGGEEWEVGSSQAITWSSTGSIANVKIEYSVNGGSDWSPIETSTSNDGTYSWTVPNTPSEDCLVKISDAADGDLSDVSDAPFTISEQPTLTVTSPDGGEEWEVGSSQAITWSSTGSIANVKIEYSVNGGSDWSPIETSTSNDGTYSWTVPNTLSENCLVRISDAADGDPSDISDAPFTISEQPTLTVTSPDGGEEWEVETSQDITWQSTGSIANVKIEYSANGGSDWSPIETSTSNDGTYSWTVPNTLSENCLVRISDAADGDPSDISDGKFSITQPNQSPVVSNPIPDTILVIGGIDFTRDLNAFPAVFSDPDSDELSYATNSSEPSVADATISESLLSVSPLSEGSANVTVTANDNRGGQASTNFTVRVGMLNSPENLRAILQDSSVILTWDPPSSTSFFTLENYCIYYSKQSDPFNNPLDKDTTDANTTSFTHEHLTVGDEWHYAITAIYNGGRESPPCAEINIIIVGFEDLASNIPNKYMLKQNYPNPFNPSTTIRFDLPKASHVVINVYDILGHKVKTLVNERYQPGSHSVVWDGNDENGLSVTSGTYLLRMQASEFVMVKKILLLK
jgi:C1A family cysteine protease